MMMSWSRGRAWLMLLMVSAAASWARSGDNNDRLPVISTAPEFVLDASAGGRVSLANLRGKVLVITFIFTTCTATCPILTAKMAHIQRQLGADFGTRVNFVSITVDPLNDTPDRLRGYAAAHGANMPGWHFLTGKPSEISDVLHRYSVYAKKSERGELEHLFLTSLVDRKGMLRLQYLGTRFDPAEMQADLQKLLRE
jgi:protein SCO1/2